MITLQITFPIGLSSDIAKTLEPVKIETIDKTNRTKVKKRYIGVLRNFEELLKNVRGSQFIKFTVEPDKYRYEDWKWIND